jgi:hypothetical protein
VHQEVREVMVYHLVSQAHPLITPVEVVVVVTVVLAAPVARVAVARVALLMAE